MYEADAFARFAGRALPTAYHWVRAASVLQAASVVPLSNLNGKGLARVGEFSAVSDVGAFDMAGNAKEWCANQVTGKDERFVLGGSWRDPTYAITFADARQPLDRSEDQGFRLVTYLSPIPEVLAREIPPVARSVREPVSDEVFGAYRTLYKFDEVPLDAKVEARDDSHAVWIKERITFASTPGVRMTAYLLLPRNVAPPYQAMLFAPTGAAVAKGDSSTLRDSLAFTAVVQSGRAVLYPIYDGTYERYNGLGMYPLDTRAFNDWRVRIVNEGRRAHAYLRSRSDIRTDAIGVLAASWGVQLAVKQLALDPGLKTAVLMDGGLTPNTPREFDLVSYLPRVRIPTLMINGDSDFIYPVETAQKPAFAALGSEAALKRHRILPGGHYVISQQRNQVVREVLDWLDTHLGPVRARADASASTRK
jgi:pimeloyl-ACP methyl ester carboxylesterase